VITNRHNIAIRLSRRDWFRPSRRRSAFSWAEILVGIVAVFLLLSVACPGIERSKIRSGVARARRDLRLIAQALDAYRLDHGAYPPSVDSVYRTRIPEGIYGAPRFAPPLTAHRQALAPLAGAGNYLKDGVDFNAPFIARAWEICEAEGRSISYSYWYNNYNDFHRTARGARVAPRSRQGYLVLAFGPRSTGVDGISAPYGNVVPGETTVPFFNRPNDRNVYDPSRGLLSGGNIMRFGGELALEEGVPYFPEGFDAFSN
jgi:type II secretory pathway pseudopilin PulG